MTAKVIRTPFVGKLAKKNPGYKEGFIVFGDTREEVAEYLIIGFFVACYTMVVDMVWSPTPFHAWLYLIMRTTLWPFILLFRP